MAITDLDGHEISIGQRVRIPERIGTVIEISELPDRPFSKERIVIFQIDGGRQAVITRDEIAHLEVVRGG